MAQQIQFNGPGQYNGSGAEMYSAAGDYLKMALSTAQGEISRQEKINKDNEAVRESTARAKLLDLSSKKELTDEDYNLAGYVNRNELQKQIIDRKKAEDDLLTSAQSRKASDANILDGIASRNVNVEQLNQLRNGIPQSVLDQKIKNFEAEEIIKNKYNPKIGKVLSPLEEEKLKAQIAKENALTAKAASYTANGGSGTKGKGSSTTGQFTVDDGLALMKTMGLNEESADDRNEVLKIINKIRESKLDKANGKKAFLELTTNNPNSFFNPFGEYSVNEPNSAQLEGLIRQGTIDAAIGGY
jgi:hypothetical protein